MKKTIFIFGIAAFLSAITLYNCKKDATTSTTKSAKITGTVTYESSLKAGGAIVTISSSPNATAVITKVVTDADGKYTVPGLADGTYYLSAKYNTANTNLKSATDIFFTTGSEINVAVSGSDLVKDIALVSGTASGTDKIDMTWTFDQTHSHVGFAFDYDSANAEFSGHFALYGINNLVFDQATPSNSIIDVWVDITSTETGAATTIDTVNKKAVGGRDGLNGCISHTFGVQYAAADTFFKGYYRPNAVIGTTGRATFVSSSVAVYGDGYVAKGDMTFHGLTKGISLFFHYIKGYSGKDRSGVMNDYSSLSGFFDMNALADFGISSSHIKSKPVHVTTNLEFYKKQ